jgi:hypothetical protein
MDRPGFNEENRMKKSFAILFIILLLALSACATSATSVPKVSSPGLMPAGTAAPAASSTSRAAADKASTGGAGLAESSSAPADVTRLVIRNADLSLVVDSPNNGMSSIIKLAADLNGYVVTSRLFKTRTSSGSEVPQANITVRIPAEKLDEALAKIKGLVRDPNKDILSDTITGKDVTADYVDLQSRLTNLQNTEAQLKKIQDSATKTEDVLQVFNQLTQIRQQIEQIKGQIKYYEESSSMSAISVSLISSESIAPITIGGWAPAGIVRDAFQTLIDVAKVLVEVLIWLIVFFLPLGLVLYFPGRWILRRIRRWLANRPKPQPMPNPYGPLPPYPPNMPPQPPQA